MSGGSNAAEILISFTVNCYNQYFYINAMCNLKILTHSEKPKEIFHFISFFFLNYHEGL